MADIMTPARRSEVMSRIRSRNTKPEKSVRSLVHLLGYRFRLHRRSLPGTPDLVFPGRHKVIFVHGCFWHAHKGCKYAVRPKTRAAFWTSKLNGNRERDKQAIKELHKMGWDTHVVWECELSDRRTLEKRLARYLDNVGGKSRCENTRAATSGSGARVARQ
jgi:DNA mismatch endonuclease (patch repair protein)